MQTCRHFRNQLPRELADELKDADPEPCPICDAMPHRRRLVNGHLNVSQVRVVAAAPVARQEEAHSWLSDWLAFLHRRQA